ncbi:Stf0 family sulfotransferase [Caballeronia ptereochthonis]|uniref:Stf0 sulfotransferase n=1 Tax=Caballeronia ptereochthonis TaxID=1777144 RepID=A0A157ZYH7_9BURK|nr:Stf0 family sulfotransferase [Caballeronia ptereochthonis]SAK50560.1 Stf0 sulfotransferase [Caballeronia ptereochthonis]
MTDLAAELSRRAEIVAPEIRGTTSGIEMTDKRTPAELPETDRQPALRLKTLLICSANQNESDVLARLMTRTGILGRPLESFDHSGARPRHPARAGEFQEQSDIAGERRTTEHGVLCAKTCPEGVDEILPSFPLGSLTDLRLIYLTRQDILGQAISLALARQTPRRATDTGERSPAHYPAYHSEDIRRISEELLHERTRWERYFVRNGISPLRIAYEDVVDRPQQVVERIADYAGVMRSMPGQDSPHESALEADEVSEHRDMQSPDAGGGGPTPERVADREEIRQHWAQAENFDLSWNERARMAVDFLEPQEKWVCDIGCGPVEAVRALLPPDATYLAADMKQWGPHVALCDLNLPMLPEWEMSAADVCMFLGVFEYVADLPRAMRAIAARCDTLIFSYCSTDVTSDRWWLWANSYSGADIVNLLRSIGFVLQKMVAYHPGQYVFRAKRLTGIPAETRLASRASRPVNHKDGA